MKGRPKRSSGDAGRELLVAAALDMLREPHIDLSRKELAVNAGVTPALVTYYFADQESILDAVAQPILDRYLRQLHDIVNRSMAAVDKFKEIIILLLRISRIDGHLLDAYISYAKRSPGTPLDFRTLAGQELNILFRQCEDEGFFRTSVVALAQTVLWGACKAVAQTKELNPLLFDQGLSDTEVEERQAGMILDLLLHGLARAPG